MDETATNPVVTTRSVFRSNSTIDSNNTTITPDLVGRQIKVQWPSGKWYQGLVKSVCTLPEDKIHGTHIVLYYDDNED